MGASDLHGKLRFIPFPIKLPPSEGRAPTLSSPPAFLIGIQRQRSLYRRGKGNSKGKIFFDIFLFSLIIHYLCPRKQAQLARVGGLMYIMK